MPVFVVHMQGELHAQLLELFAEDIAGGFFVRFGFRAGQILIQLTQQFERTIDVILGDGFFPQLKQLALVGVAGDFDAGSKFFRLGVRREQPQEAV